MINKLFIFLLIIPAISHCLECNYEFKEKGGSYKVQLKIKNKNDVLLQLFTNGIMTESCKGKSENYFGNENQVKFTHQIYFNLSCKQFLKTHIKLNQNGKLKFQEDNISRGMLNFSEYRQSELCRFGKRKLQQIKALKKLNQLQ